MQRCDISKSCPFWYASKQKNIFECPLKPDFRWRPGVQNFTMNVFYWRFPLHRQAVDHPVAKVYPFSQMKRSLVVRPPVHPEWKTLVLRPPVRPEKSRKHSKNKRIKYIRLRKQNLKKDGDFVGKLTFLHIAGYYLKLSGSFNKTNFFL